MTFYEAYDLASRWRDEAYANYLTTSPKDPHGELGRCFRLGDIMAAVHRQALRAARSGGVSE